MKETKTYNKVTDNSKNKVLKNPFLIVYLFGFIILISFVFNPFFLFILIIIIIFNKDKIKSSFDFTNISTSFLSQSKDFKEAQAYMISLQKKYGLDLDPKNKINRQKMMEDVKKYFENKKKTSKYKSQLIYNSIEEKNVSTLYDINSDNSETIIKSKTIIKKNGKEIVNSNETKTKRNGKEVVSSDKNTKKRYPHSSSFNNGKSIWDDYESVVDRKK